MGKLYLASFTFKELEGTESTVNRLVHYTPKHNNEHENARIVSQLCEEFWKKDERSPELVLCVVRSTIDLDPPKKDGRMDDVLGDFVARQCRANGYNSIEDLYKASDSDLLRISGFGKMRLQRFRNTYNEDAETQAEIERTDRNVEVVASFIEHCKEEGFVIPDKYFESFFDA